MGVDLVTLLPFLFTIATAAAAAVAYFRASYAKATIETLEKNNSALTDRVTILERDLAAANVKVAAVEQENVLLRTLVPAEETLGVILVTLQELHAQHRDMLEILRHRPPEMRTRSTDANA